MVLREKRICNHSDNVQLQLSYGVPDVKALMKIYAEMSKNIRDYPETESDVRFWLEHDARCFANYPQKWKRQLSGWAFCVAVRNRLLEPTATNENHYHLADCLFAKRGRPKKDE